MTDEMFNKGATLIVLDVPEGTEFGIDCNSWNVGPNFKGIRNIPPGIHFIYYSAVSGDHDVAPRTGFFHDFAVHDILIRKWNKQREDVTDPSLPAEQQKQMLASMPHFDTCLGSYPRGSYKKWVSLTCHLNPAVVKKLMPLSGTVHSVAQSVSPSSTTQSRAADKYKNSSSAKYSDEDLPDLFVMPETNISFTPIPKQSCPEGSSPEQITHHSLDLSYCLVQLLDSAYSEKKLDILAELQFSFIMFLIGNVYGGLEQWKKILRVLCLSDAALCTHSELYEKFISTLYYQVHEIPDDFFVDIITQDNFLVTLLHTLFANLSECSVKNLKEKGQRFKNYLEQKFKWDFSTDVEDNCPVIVYQTSVS